MPLPISLTFAGAFALLNLWLAYRCVRIRVNGPGGVGDLGIPVLQARMRAHANFVEYTPFVLILMALLEYAGGSVKVLEGAGIGYFLARVLHAFGMERPRFTMQLIGAVGTWTVLLALAIWAIWTASAFDELVMCAKLTIADIAGVTRQSALDSSSRSDAATHDGE